MRYGLLKSLLGKHICKSNCIEYCHIDRIIVIEGQKAIATAIVKTLDNRILHWFVETSWITDNGVHNIKNYIILKEDELNGYTTQDASL